MANKKSLRVFPDDHVTVLDLGDMEIWDGADMALLRESLTRLIKTERRRSIGIDMSHVKYIPSGFFGMLFDWHEIGIQIRLYDPQPNVRRMLWFNRFFKAIDGQCHELHSGPAHVVMEEAAVAADAEEEPRPRNGRRNGHASLVASGVEDA